VLFPAGIAFRHHIVAASTADGGVANDSARPSETSLWSHILVALVNSNGASLSTASRSTLDTAALLAKQGNKLTVMFLDEVPDQGGAPKTEAALARAQQVEEELAAKGLQDVAFIEETIEQSGGKGSVAVGEAVDSVGADLVVLHSAAVHDHMLDANLLAEFCDAPLLLLP
jgi:hypothetical protein